MILREKNDNSSGGGRTAAADGTLELRRHYLQNWRADVSAMVKADGTQVERVKYSAYGVPIDLTPGDFNVDAAITGYQHAPELLGTKWHVRHRVLDSELGRRTRRDPSGCVDGANLLITFEGTVRDRSDR